MNPISDEEFEHLQINLLVDSTANNDLRNLDLTVSILKAMELEFVRRNNAGVCYGPLAFEKWLTEHLLARNKRPHLILVELVTDGSPILQKIAKNVLSQRYGETESNEISLKALRISKWALIVSIIIPLSIAFWKDIWKFFIYIIN